MQITIQMLDGSITPFKVRSSITIASLKAKFEPWQPMKGRALLHHNVQLDDRATLCSVSGVKNGTILRVDKQVSQVKNKTAGKKTVMSGSASSAVDEDVVESIERSGDDEETSSENEMRISSIKRKRPSRASAAAVENFIDDDIIANPSRGKAPVPSEMSDDSLSTADTNLRKRTMALHIAKKEEKGNTAREQAKILASKAQNSGPPLHPLKKISTSHRVQSPTASPHTLQTIEAVPSHQDVIEDDSASFLAGINAAAAETERSPLHFEAGPAEDISARRCDACGRACGCDGAISHSVVPVEEGLRGQEAASTKSNSNGMLIAKINSANQRVESSWTGM